MSPELEHIRREAERLTCRFSEADWQKAAPGKWSCAQIIEHLRLTYTATTRGLLNGMQTGRPLASTQTVRDWLRIFWVVKLGFMPSGRVAPLHTAPENGVEMPSLSRFFDALVAMDATLADAERRFGVPVKLLDHPMLGPMTAKEWRQLHRTHARHHFKQLAERAGQVQGLPPDREFSHNR